MNQHEIVEHHQTCNAAKKQEGSMIHRIMSKLFSPFKEELIDYTGKGLTELNGQQKLLSGNWKDLLINGQAFLGANSKVTTFRKILVVNGNLQAQNCHFDLLDVRGSFKVNDCVLKLKGIFFGNGQMKSCTTKDLHLKSPGGHLVIKNSTVDGDVTYSAMGHMFGGLTLDNAIVSGHVITTKEDRNKVQVINSPGSIKFKEVEKTN